MPTLCHRVAEEIMTRNGTWLDCHQNKHDKETCHRRQPPKQVEIKRREAESGSV